MDSAKKRPGGNAYSGDNQPDRRLKTIKKTFFKITLPLLLSILALPLLMVLLSTAEPVRAG